MPPRFDPDDTSPENRRFFLAKYARLDTMPRSGKTGLQRLIDAELLVDACDEDVQQAREVMARLKAAGALEPEQARGRHLSPYARRMYVDLLQAVDTWQEAVAASERARTELYAMQRSYNQATKPLADRRELDLDGEHIGLTRIDRDRR